MEIVIFTTILSNSFIRDKLYRHFSLTTTGKCTAIDTIQSDQIVVSNAEMLTNVHTILIRHIYTENDVLHGDVRIRVGKREQPIKGFSRHS